MANPNTQITGLTGAESEYQHTWSGPNSGLSAEMKTFYDMNLIDEASAALVHDQFGQKRPIPKNGGRTIEFRKFDSLPKALTAMLPNGIWPSRCGAVFPNCLCCATPAIFPAGAKSWRICRSRR